MAMATYQVTFHGISAHAAMSPESGRSALDAVLLAAHGIECLREHVKEDTRLHYTVKDAGGPSTWFRPRRRRNFVCEATTPTTSTA